MNRSYALLIMLSLLAALAGCDEPSPLGPMRSLLEVGRVELGVRERGRMATVSQATRCAMVDPTNDARAFEFEVASQHADAPEPELLAVEVSASSGPCEFEATLEGPQRFLRVAGVRKSEATVRLTYRCPDFSGSGSIVASTAESPVAHMSGAQCTGS
ncbi:MAG: hypothetical protein AAF411_00365 [Myxococcota bacterium]